MERSIISTLAMAAVCSCSSKPLAVNQPSRGEQLFAATANWPAFAEASAAGPPRGAVDIVFVVDNSASMAPLQQQLAAGFDAFMNVIDGLPGGPPDLHIGVVSSDMGAGDGSLAGCNGQGGDRGALQFAPRGACTATGLDPTARFIALRTETDGSRTTNYGAAGLSDVFGCIALLGEAGCGFEQPFSSVQYALDPALAPDDNAGFLRRDAFLGVIIISNEDDCSVGAGAALFYTTSNTNVGSQLGPPTNFRCNEFGHLCDVNGRLQRPPRTATGELTGCRSNESDGYLESVASVIRFLRWLKSDPAKVFVASVAGPPTPYQVNLTTPPISDDAPWPTIGHSCAGPGGIFGDPAVRLNQLTETLGPYGHFETICGDSMNTSLSHIATMMTKPLAFSCVARPASAAGCQVLDRLIDGSGGKAVTEIPPCAQTGSGPCWSLVNDPSCLSTEQRLVVDRAGAPVPAGVMTAIDCTGAPLPW